MVPIGAATLATGAAWPNSTCNSTPCDARQCLAPKTEGREMVEIFKGAQLRGRVALQRDRQLIRRDPIAVVSDFDQFEPATTDRDRDPPRVGVDRVLDQFFDDRGGALDDLASGDLADRIWSKEMNGHVRAC
jgi:hypothetical protein